MFVIPPGALRCNAEANQLRKCEQSNKTGQAKCFTPKMLPSRYVAAWSKTVLQLERNTSVHGGIKGVIFIGYRQNSSSQIILLRVSWMWE